MKREPSVCVCVSFVVCVWSTAASLAVYLMALAIPCQYRLYRKYFSEGAGALCCKHASRSINKEKERAVCGGAAAAAAEME